MEDKYPTQEEVELARKELTRIENSKVDHVTTNQALRKLRDNHLEEYKFIKQELKGNWTHPVKQIVEERLLLMPKHSVIRFATIAQVRREKGRLRREWKKE